jgi:hypothetical protein
VERIAKDGYWPSFSVTLMADTVDGRPSFMFRVEKDGGRPVFAAIGDRWSIRSQVINEFVAWFDRAALEIADHPG